MHEEDISIPSMLSLSLAMMLLISPVLSNFGEGGRFEEDSPLSLDGIFWPMTGRDPYNTHEGEAGGRGIQDPVFGWSETDNTTSPGGVSSEMTDNIVFSGVERTSKRFIVDSNNTHIMARDGDTGKVAWSVDVRMIEGRTTNRLFSSPALLDIDDDDRVEVLASITDGGSHQLALFEPNITLSSSGYSYSSQAFFEDRVWLSTSGVIGPIIASTPTLYDISGDGIEDIIVGAGNRLFSYYGNNGTINWFLEIGPVGETIGTPAIYPGSGALRRIVVSSLPPDKSSLRTTVVNFQGLHLKNITVDPAPPPLVYTHVGPIPMPAVSDLDGDGNREIIIPYPANSGLGMVVIYSYSLEELVSIEDIPGTFEGSVALADLNGDSTDEILLQSRIFTLTSSTIMTCREVSRELSDWGHSTLWTRNGANIGTSPVYATPLACDLNEDSVPDALFRSNGVIYGILSDGTHYWNLTVSGHISNGNGLIGDLNTDDFLDFYLQGRMFTQKVVDLKIKDPPGTNIYLDDPQPVDGSPVTVNCVVENTKRTSVEDVVVRFIDLDGPGGDPVIIGDDRVDLTDTAEASVEWTPDGDGDHIISVIIDPDGNITETDETNNQGENSFNILPAFPDLTITGMTFLRGDGRKAGDSIRLVEKDPSTIVVTVANIGQKPVNGGTLRVNVNEDAPTGGSEMTSIDPIVNGRSLNVSVRWTPQNVAGEEETFKVEAWILPPQGVQEISSDNNNITDFTDVKSREPVGSFYLQGQVNGTDGEPEENVRVTVTIDRTGESLGPITTGSDGMYGFDFNFLTYLDADIVTVRASKDQMWGENTTRIYSEDITKDLPVRLTDIPTLSIFVSPEGSTEFEVVPGEEVSLDLSIVNDGNIGGDVQVTKEQTGNSTLSSAGILLTPNTFSLEPGNSRDVEVSFTVPDGEDPGREISLEITASISANGTETRKLVYTMTVVGDEQALVQMVSARNVSLGPGEDNMVSFELYVFNRGNVPFEYRLSVSSSLEDTSEFRSGSGQLLPGDGVSPYVDVTLPNGSDSVSGTITVLTSGLGTVGSYDIRIERAFPDLVVTGVIGSEPTDPILGEEIQLMARVQNNGEIPVTGVRCTFYEDGSIIGTRTIGRELRPGEEATVSGVGWNPSDIGEHRVSFVVDPDEEFLETDEENNQLERTFSFYPDLSIRSFSVGTGTLVEGERASFRVSVENEGNAPLSRGFIVTVNIDTSTGEQLISKNFDFDLDPSIDPEETVTLEFILPGGGGNRTFYVTVEPVGEDLEQDTSDNTASREVDIRGKEDDTGFMDYLPFIGIAILILLIIGGAFYVWRFGLPSSPPPEEEPEEGPEEGVKVESGEVPETEEADEVPGMEEPPSPDDVPVMEMEIAPEEEPVMVAEVVEAEIEEEEETPENELVPEV